MQNIIVYVIVAAAIIYGCRAIVKYLKSIDKKGGKCTNCNSCPLAKNEQSECCETKKDDKNKFTT